MDIFATIEADLKAAWGVLEGEAVADAEALWNTFKGLFTALQPAQYAILNGLITKALADVTDGDIADVETAVLNFADAEFAWVKELGSETLQALIAVEKSAQAQVQAVVASTANTVAEVIPTV